MFLRNESGLEVVLAKGRLTDQTAVLSVNLEVGLELTPDGSMSTTCVPTVRPHTYPPDARKVPLWRGTSVTASGSVRGPEQPPYRREISLTVNGETQRLLASGARRWVRTSDGRLTPSEPEPFTTMPMSWELAFGGSFAIPPGMDADSGLPHPGGRVSHPENPKGIGMYRDAEAAEGEPLPRVEACSDLIVGHEERPQPACFAPCQDLPGLRLDARRRLDLQRAVSADRVSDDGVAAFMDQALRNQHAAPGSLIFDWLESGTHIALRGMGARDLLFTVPAAPTTVCAVRGRLGAELRGRLRYLHLDADEATALAGYGFAHRYDPKSPPHWLDVQIQGEVS